MKVRTEDEIKELLTKLTDKELDLIRVLTKEGEDIFGKYTDENIKSLTESDLEKLLTNKIIIDSIIMKYNK